VNAWPVFLAATYDQARDAHIPWIDAGFGGGAFKIWDRKIRFTFRVGLLKGPGESQDSGYLVLRKSARSIGHLANLHLPHRGH
jgi:hypothetical protein